MEADGMNEINVNMGRKISVENAQRIGHGFFSDVYRIDPETVVKVLNNGTVQDAEREILLSKWALQNGIPTAISYDVADVNGHPGLVYELLGRGSLKDQLLDHPEDFDRRMRQYAALLHCIHAGTDTEGRLPKAGDRYKTKIDSYPGLTQEERQRLRMLLDTIPDTDHVVHCDCHFKNIKVVKDELMLIDLDTLSRGDPIYDLLAVRSSYQTFNEARNATGTDPFFDLPVDYEKRVLDTLLCYYFEGLSEKQITENLKKIRLLSYWDVLRFIDDYSGETQYDQPGMLRRFRQSLGEVNDLRLIYR